MRVWIERCCTAAKVLRDRELVGIAATATDRSRHTTSQTIVDEHDGVPVASRIASRCAISTRQPQSSGYQLPTALSLSLSLSLSRDVQERDTNER